MVTEKLLINGFLLGNSNVRFFASMTFLPEILASFVVNEGFDCIEFDLFLQSKFFKSTNTSFIACSSCALIP